MVQEISTTINTNSRPRYHLSKEDAERIRLSQDHIVNSDLKTKSRIAIDKFENNVSVYPIKGITGNKNSNFYEFLSMGSIPYVVGSLVMMALPNLANKYFKPEAAKSARKIGHKMALGVLFFGIAKNLAPYLISKPLKYKTGIDIDQPYKKIVYEFPTKGVETPKKIEYHKVFESTEFTRWDLLYNKGKSRNSYYDEIARKTGLGENLPASDQAAKPEIRKRITKARASSTIISYLWAGLGVAYAMQKPWENLFANKTNEKGFLKKAKYYASEIGKTAVESAKHLYKAPDAKTKVQKHAGKAFLFTAVAATLIGNYFTLKNSKQHKANNRIMSQEIKTMEC